MSTMRLSQPPAIANTYARTSHNRSYDNPRGVGYTVLVGTRSDGQGGAGGGCGHSLAPGGYDVSRRQQIQQCVLNQEEFAHEKR